MCRSIKKLRRPSGQPTDTEIREAALQFVRKISGYRVPSRINEEAFNAAIDDVTNAAKSMFENMQDGKNHGTEINRPTSQRKSTQRI